MRRLSEESIRTEDCEGPILDSAMDHVTLQPGILARVSSNGEAICSDRAELMERIKRGESPTWIPNQAVSRPWSYCQNMVFAYSLKLHGRGLCKPASRLWFA